MEKKKPGLYDNVEMKNDEPMIRINGRAQILDMLRTADAEFRELILTRLAKRDRKLAQELREEL